MSEKDVKETELIQLPNLDLEEYKESKIAQLQPRHQRFVHMYLSGSYKVPQIAEILKVEEGTVRGWLRNPKIKAAIEEYQRDEEEIVTHNLKALRLKALYKMNDLMESDIDGIAYQAARDILDRTGFKAAQKQDVKIEVYNYEQQIKEIIGNDSRFIEADYEVEDE